MNDQEKQHSKMQSQFKDLCSICLQVKKVHGDEFLKTKSIYKTCPLDTYRTVAISLICSVTHISFR